MLSYLGLPNFLVCSSSRDNPSILEVLSWLNNPISNIYMAYWFLTKRVDPINSPPSVRHAEISESVLGLPNATEVTHIWILPEKSGLACFGPS